jgi:hypothetical protein
MGQPDCYHLDMDAVFGISFWILIALFALMYSLLRASEQASHDETSGRSAKISIVVRGAPAIVATACICGIIALKVLEPYTPKLDLDRYGTYRITAVFALTFIAGASSGIGLAKLFRQPQLAFAIGGIVVMPFVVLTGAFLYEMVVLLVSDVASRQLF